MELGLRGKIGIVTGASMGIGKAIAEELTAEGVRLALCSRGEPLWQEVATAIRQQQHDVDVLPVAADLSALAGVPMLVRWDMMMERLAAAQDSTPQAVEAVWRKANPWRRPGGVFGFRPDVVYQWGNRAG